MTGRRAWRKEQGKGYTGREREKERARGWYIGFHLGISSKKKGEQKVADWEKKEEEEQEEEGRGREDRAVGKGRQIDR